MADDDDFNDTFPEIWDAHVASAVRVATGEVHPQVARIAQPVPDEEQQQRRISMRIEFASHLQRTSDLIRNIASLQQAQIAGVDRLTKKSIFQGNMTNRFVSQHSSILKSVQEASG